jgi:hypothetical protein
VTRDLARENVLAFDEATRASAIEVEGYDPKQTRFQPREVIKLIDPRLPRLLQLQ